MRCVPTTGRIVVPHGRRARRSTASRGAFTLMEVMLAIGIAAAILFVLVYFYQRAAELRTQLLQETDRLATERLLMTRLETELRCVPGRCFYKPTLTGDATSIQFIKTELPSRNAWRSGVLGRAAVPETDLRLVKYSLAGDGTNATGIVRTEEPMVTRQTAARSEVTVELPEETNRPAPPLTADLRHLRFRYWDGSFWQDAWHLDQMPLGVEITLAAEPIAEDATPEELAGQVFRRAIFLPASRPIVGGAEGDTIAPPADMTELVP